MNRSRLEPLGVPPSDYGLNDADAQRQEPTRFDRWLVKQITSKLSPLGLTPSSAPAGRGAGSVCQMPNLRVLARGSVRSGLVGYYSGTNFGSRV